MSYVRVSIRKTTFNGDVYHFQCAFLSFYVYVSKRERDVKILSNLFLRENNNFVSFHFSTDGVVDENGQVVAKDGFVDDDADAAGSDSASVVSGTSDKDVTMPTLESLEPESNGYVNKLSIFKDI